MRIGLPKIKWVEIAIVERCGEDGELKFRIPVSDASALQVRDKILEVLQTRKKLTAIAVKILKENRKAHKGICTRCGAPAMQYSPYMCRDCKNRYQNRWNRKKARIMKKLEKLG
jgi:hypothetical protein